MWPPLGRSVLSLVRPCILLPVRVGVAPLFWLCMPPEWGPPQYVVYIRRVVQSFGRQFSRSQAKASPKRVGEFLKPCGSLVQVNCPFAPVSGSSHSNANSDWLASASCRQKKASLRSRHVNTLAVGGIKLSRVYRLGTTGWMVSVASFTLHKSWTGR
jgi:hypothetical protein